MKMFGVKKYAAIGFFALAIVCVFCLSGLTLIAEAEELGVENAVIIGESTYVITDRSTLVAANRALLENDAKGNDGKAVSGVFGGVSCNGYEAVYAKVYDMLLDNATATISNGGSIIIGHGNRNTSQIRIYKISGTVKLTGSEDSGYHEVLNTGKTLFVSEDTATIEFDQYGRFSIGWNSGSDQSECCLSIQGRSSTKQIKLVCKDLGSMLKGKPCFNFMGGDLYLHQVDISGFEFGASEGGDAVVYMGNGFNNKRGLYMSRSAMHDISGKKSPGFFLKGYTETGNNEENALTELMFYKNSFYDCKVNAGSNYAGGPVIRSFAADCSYLRVEECSFVNNHSLATGVASGGGAVYWKSAAGKADLVNCVFEGNGSSTVGGAVFNTGVMNIYGCEFKGNSAVQGGGAIAAEPPRTSQHFNNIKTNELSGSMTLDSSTVITGNSTEGYGGAIYFNALEGDNGANADPKEMIEEYKMSITLDGATVSRNTAKFGGAVAMLLNYGGYKYQTGVSILSGSTVEENEATENGGAIWMSSTAGCKRLETQGVTMSGGILQGNTAKNGGAIYIETASTDGEEMNFTMSGGVAQSNTAHSNGGAAYVAGGNFLMQGGDLGVDGKPNKAAYGGGVYVSGGNTVITNGSVSCNIATENGGGVCVQNGNVVMSGGKIDGNKATNGAGGGMYVAASGADVKVDVYSGSVSGNSAKTYGGALAVCGTVGGSENINVTLGLHMEHIFDGNGDLIPIEHSPYTHTSCPELRANSSGVGGGGLYVKGGDNTYFNIYCLIETQNKVNVDRSLSNFMLIEGGVVTVSTAETHSDSTSNGDSVNGDTEIQNSVYVVGGKVDLYGATTNPSFANSITVDIKTLGDHFKDHRYNDGFYKLIYFENYLDPETGIVSGQYTAFQIPAGETIIISGVIYSHPGYDINGWNTDDEGAGDWYYPDDEHIMNANLEIYAIWRAFGYTVQFKGNSANVFGSMADQIIMYDVEANLDLNAFKNPGHIFNGWKDKDGKTYTDGQKVKNLSAADGGIVILYAQWRECIHSTEEPKCSFTYTVTEGGSALQRECSCLGQTLTARLLPSDTVYNGTPRPANCLYSAPEIWKPQISYYMGGEGLMSAPTYAGEYVAKVMDGGKTAELTYVIQKAPQPLPAKPEFEVVGNTLTVTGTSTSPYASEDPTIKTYYQLFYYIGSAVDHQPESEGNTFTLDAAYTSYYVVAWYSEGVNYARSSDARSSETYYYKGKTQIAFSVENGIDYSYENNDGAGGIVITVSADTQYYLTEGFSVTEDHNAAGGAEISVTSQYSTYVLQNIPDDDNLKITVTISGAKLKPIYTQQIEAGEKFGTVNGSVADITKQSSFSAYYSAEHFDPSVYGDLSLEFYNTLTVPMALKEGASVIMMDKSAGNVTYWYYVATGGETSVMLSEFTKMGGTGGYTVPLETSHLKLQFVADLADTDGLEGDMQMVLKAQKNDSRAPEHSQSAEITVNNEQTLEMSVQTDGINADISFTCTENGGLSTKYNGRSAALVLTPNSSDIPGDMIVVATFPTGESKYISRNVNGDYIVPMYGIGNNGIVLSLSSMIAPVERTEYSFNIAWYAANSVASASPANGELIRELSGIVFVKEEQLSPSLIITGTDYILQEKSTLTVNVSYDLPVGCTVTADVMYKDEKGNYSSTAQRINVTEEGPLSVSLSSQKPGSFCLTVVVKHGVDTVLTVPYYFIIE